MPKAEDVDLFIDAEGIVREGRLVKRVTSQEVTAWKSDIPSTPAPKGWFSSFSLTGRKESEQRDGFSLFNIFSFRKKKLDKIPEFNLKLKEAIRPRSRAWKNNLYANDHEDDHVAKVMDWKDGIEESGKKFLFDSEGNPLYNFQNSRPSYAKSNAESVKSAESGGRRSTRSNSRPAESPRGTTPRLESSKKSTAIKKAIKKERKDRRKSFSDGYISIDEEERNKGVSDYSAASEDAYNQTQEDVYNNIRQDNYRPSPFETEEYYLPSPPRLPEIVSKPTYHRQMTQPIPQRQVTSGSPTSRSQTQSMKTGAGGKFSRYKGEAPFHEEFIPKQQSVSRGGRRQRSHRKSISDGELSPDEAAKYRMQTFRQGGDILGSRQGTRGAYKERSPRPRAGARREFEVDDRRSVRALTVATGSKYSPTDSSSSTPRYPHAAPLTKLRHLGKDESLSSDEDVNVERRGGRRGGRKVKDDYGYDCEQAHEEAVVMAAKAGKKDQRSKILEELKKWEWKEEDNGEFRIQEKGDSS